MSTSASFAAVSAANNAMAQAAAQAAKVERCTIEVGQLVNAGSTVEQKLSFADCVNTLWPQAMSESSITMLKVSMALTVIGAIVGAVHGWREDGDFNGAFLFCIVGGGLTATALAVLALIFYIATL